MGGVTAYANEAKVHMIGVRPDTLVKYGAVSAEIVIEMARGVRGALAADIGVSVSGIAGPDGGTPDKPVGTVWIGVSSPKDEYARHYLWAGDRITVKEQSAQAALDLLVEHIQNYFD